jgi:Fe-S-cluster containining protein
MPHFPKSQADPVMRFPCTRCGVCCLKAGTLLRTLSNHPGLILEDFQLELEPDGACSKLDRETMTCTVYETRPRICRSDVPSGHDPQAWHQMLADYCNGLQRVAGIDKRFRVILMRKDAAHRRSMTYEY